MEQIFNAVLAIVVGVGGMMAYYYGVNYAVDLLFPDRVEPDGTYVSQTNLRESIRPWLFVLPAVLILFFYLVYPAVQTLFESFLVLNQSDRTRSFGFNNYVWAITDAGFHQSIINNIAWLIIVPFLSTAFGLVVAVLADRVSWENVAKSLIFMPMAISFVGASIIWKFVYEYRPEGEAQIGILNAVITSLGGSPQTWYTSTNGLANSFALMVILIWIQAGFAMVLLSAALKGVPEETLEAARIDGANEIQIFFRIMIPQIYSTIVVVMTTIIIVVLKVFDIVFTMTNGLNDTEVLANYMYRWMFRNFDFGRGSMLAVILMLAITPIMIWNIVRFRQEEKYR